MQSYDDKTFDLTLKNRELAVTKEGVIFFRREGKSTCFLGKDLETLREALALADENRAAWLAAGN